MRIKIRFFGSLLIALLPPLTLIALVETDDTQPHSSFLGSTDYWINAGVFFAGFDTRARLDANAFELGTQIDLEDDLGMDSSAAFFDLQVGAKLSDRWRIEAEYMDLTRSNVSQTDRELIWGQQVIERESIVQAQFDLTIFRLLVGYDFAVAENYRMGASLGAHYVRMLAGIEGVITGDSSGRPGQRPTVIDFSLEAVSREKLPIPNFGLYGLYALSDRWLATGRVDVFKLKFGEWGGELFTVAADLRYMHPNGFSIGGGLQYLLVNVNYNTDNWRGRVEYRHFGPRLDVGFRF